MSYFSEEFRVSSDFLESGKREVVENFKQLLLYSRDSQIVACLDDSLFTRKLTFFSEVGDAI